ncbi:MAG: cobalamin-dependent protein [Thermodesulfobacteriota bacterium]
MTTHKERMLAAMRGQMVDVIPFVPRLDLWWLSNATKGTLPERFAGMMPDDVARSEGWALYHMVPNFADISSAEDILHRAIGLFNFKLSAYGWRFSPDIEVRVQENEGQQVVEYHTPVGVVRTVGGLTEQAKRAGSSLGWVQEHAIKGPDDYRVMGYIFENIEVFPQYQGHQAYIDQVGDQGVAAAGGPSLGASPMHLIQKELVDATRFYYEYKDHQKLMRELAARIEVYFEKVLAVLAESPAEVVLWGANYDDMLTYPPYFEKEILPWLRRAAEVLGGRGKILATHTDGENQGLMDLIRDCGAHVAESVTPWPMTRVRIEEYYRKWRDRLTIMGGIPESLLLPQTASREEFEGFLDHLFRSVAPGDRIILGTADSTPPEADFDRLRRIAERVEKEGRLPLAAGGGPVTGGRIEAAAARVSRDGDRPAYGEVELALANGDDSALCESLKNLLAKGVSAAEALNQGLIPAMEAIGRRFRNNEVFIPEVLLAARAMNQGLLFLEPHLALETTKTSGKVLIGTVQGDMHDLGKNMVTIMLRGVGFKVVDLGVNVARDEFLRQVREHQPDILGISALLTTTMPEMKNILVRLEEEGLRDRLKVLVGGAPVNQRFADDIGADGYAADAGEAVDLARRLMA